MPTPKGNCALTDASRAAVPALALMKDRRLMRRFPIPFRISFVILAVPFVLWMTSPSVVPAVCVPVTAKQKSR
jgi:nitrate reductase gamma subunit